MAKRYKVEFTKGELANIRWMANLGMNGCTSATTSQIATCQRGLSKMVESEGGEPVLSGGSVIFRKKK